MSHNTTGVGQPQIEMHHRPDHGEREKAAVPHRAHHAAQGIAQGGAALDHLAGDAAGEIMGEIGHGMAERVARQLQADQVVEARRVDVVVEEPHHHHAQAPADQDRQRRRPQPGMGEHVAGFAGGVDVVDQPADHQRDHRLARRDAGLQRQQHQQQALDLTDEMPDERPEFGGRRPFWRAFEIDMERHGFRSVGRSPILLRKRARGSERFVARRDRGRMQVSGTGMNCAQGLRQT